MKVAAEIKVANQLYLWLEVFLGYPVAQCSHRVLKMRQRRQKDWNQREGIMRKNSRAIAGFGNGEREQWAKKHRQPLEAGKGKKTESPRDPAKGTLSCWHLDCSPVRSRLDFWSPNCKITDLCFKPLNLRWFVPAAKSNKYTGPWGYIMWELLGTVLIYRVYSDDLE